MIGQIHREEQIADALKHEAVLFYLFVWHG